MWARRETEDLVLVDTFRTEMKLFVYLHNNLYGNMLKPKIYLHISIHNIKMDIRK